jgi:hypothetical protein
MRKLEVEYDIVRIIDCLSEKERADDEDSKKLMSFLSQQGIKQETAYCGNKVTVLHILNSLKQRASLGEKFPLVFISHGANGFLSIRHENEIIEWHELRPYFMEINNLMNGNLIVMMACCHGFNGYKIDPRDIDDEAFFGIVGPDRVISPDESIIANEVFFKNILISQEIPLAVKAINERLGEGSYKQLATQTNKLI